MYGLLFHIYADKEDWKAALKVLDEAIQDMPRTKHKLLIFKHRIMVHVRLGHSIRMDLQKLKDESEQYLSSMWRRVVVFSNKRTGKISCFQKSIEALEKPESNWQKVDHLIEFAEWLYSNDFPENDVLCLLDWAVDLLLSMKLCVKPRVEEDFKVKKKKLKSKHSQEKQKLEEQKPEKNPEPEDTGASEKEIIPLENQAQIGVQNIDPNLSLADLQDVRQLQTLIEIHTLMAIISSRASSQHKKYCLMAYAYVMCIWQATLATAGSIIKELAKTAPPSPDLLPSSKSTKKSKKKDPKETYSLFYIDLLVKELQALSYNHLTLPVLQLGEIIACDVLNNMSLSDLYHFRIAQVCIELNLISAAEYHERVPGTQFIYDKERAKVRQEIAKLQDEKSEIPEQNIQDSH
uniref:Uncharacterized protein n=1 Tax=Callorhinchus milii TaxID=7868 RepID=A0A4W3JWG3_CALMI